jgi:hypothetical protein
MSDSNVRCAGCGGETEEGFLVDYGVSGQRHAGAAGRKPAVGQGRPLGYPEARLVLEG